VTRILRAKNPSSPKTPRQSFLGTRSVTAAGTDKLSGSKHDPAQLVGRVTAKRGIRVLRAITNTANRDMTSEFTNNPNPKFDPSRAPGAVRRTTSVIRMAVGRASRGHQKVIPPNRQSQFGGKTLRRKQF
jgi:hypothetical protein